MVCMREPIIYVVRKAFSDQADVPLEKIWLDSKIKELKCDSLDLVKVVSYLEDHFSVNIKNEEIMDLKTINDVVNLLEVKVG